MNTLYQFPPMLGLPNASPFCLKLELFLRMADIPYENRYSASLNKSPTGKFPCLKLSDGNLMADSDLIIRHFVEHQSHGLDDWMSKEQQAAAHAFSRLLNEHLYWAIVYSRWVDERGWQQLYPVFFKPAPALIRPIVAGLIRRKVKRDLHGHGIGRHSEQTIYHLAEMDIAALSEQLGDKPYLMGDRICSLDASAVGHLANIVLSDFESALKRIAANYPNLEAYCRRVMAEYFEWESPTG